MYDRSRSPVIKMDVKPDNNNLIIQEFNEAGRSKGRNKNNHGFPVTIYKPTERIHEKKRFRNNRITLREKEVLELLSNGDSSKIIADKLHISETTAITHRKNLIQKLRVKNTAHLIKVAILAKIIA